MCVRWNWGPTHPGHLCREDLNWIRTLTRAMTPSQYPNYQPGSDPSQYFKPPTPFPGRQMDHCCANNSPPVLTFFHASIFFRIFWPQLQTLSMPIYFSRSQPNSLSQRLNQQMSVRRSRVFVRSLKQACNVLVQDSTLQICLVSSRKNTLTSFDVDVKSNINLTRLNQHCIKVTPAY